MKRTIFDIETDSIPREELAKFMPTEWSYGNLKDPVKIAQAKIEKEAEWIERAALSPLTGQILCIGIKTVEKSGVPKDDILDLPDGSFEEFTLLEGQEPDILNDFWELWKDSHRFFIGFNSNRFDIPFIVKRSMRWGVKIPMGVPRKGRDLHNTVDIMEVWQMGEYNDYVSLNTLAKFFGLPQKTSTGTEFAGLWHTDREKAIEYIKHDVDLTDRIAAILGV